MPATLVAAHANHVAQVVPAVSAKDLSNTERAVALYASEMPNGYRYKGPDHHVTVLAWITQGAARLGLSELYRSAAFAYGYRLLWLARTATGEQTRAHKLRFPSADRLRRAESLASLTIGFPEARMTSEAIKRSRRPQVEGACRCGGTGWIDTCFDPDDPTTAVSTNCPGHNPEGYMPRPVVVA
ncbi:hypothetical protein ACIHJG_09555 [Streptomyces sp. NPDC052415]|uniref:hypothetical protein n=1 Tax=Streptomyces sp. NPDC052415 TaxID=3365690 RepID=UPI0037CEECDC